MVVVHVDVTAPAPDVKIDLDYPEQGEWALYASAPLMAGETASSGLMAAWTPFGAA